MKILITGASSYVGARVYFDLSKNFNVVGTYHSSKLSESFIKLDATNKEDIIKVLEEEKPDIIVHLAANASSKWCEANPEEAIALNESSTRYIVDTANKIGAKVIYISSFAAFEPKDVYAKTKYNSEQLVKKVKAGWVVLRPSLILGYSPNTTNDRPFNRLLKNLDDGTPAEYDTSWKFQPTYLGQISEVIEEVIKRNISEEIIPIAVDELKSRYDTAKDILSPFEVKVVPIDMHDTGHFSEKKDTSKLEELSLPVYTYDQMISKILEEIKNRKTFKL
jgi:dTDP-4-dehydrorhamnose reductase